MIEREAESRRRVEQESEVAKALVEETMGKVELLQQQHKQAIKSLQVCDPCNHPACLTGGGQGQQ